MTTEPLDVPGAAPLPTPESWRADKHPGHPVVGALSPSRASDFTTCPLLYRYRVIDRLPEPPSQAATRGTLVHNVLERLFDHPAPERVLETAIELLPSTWDELVQAAPELESLIAAEGADATPSQVAEWLASAEPLLRTYFTMEDPRLLEPAFRELHVEHPLPDGPVLRGFIDRVDIADGVGVRIVDYKTGRAPGPAFEQKAVFQLRFYALVVWRMTGVLPRLLQLNYLGSGEFLRYEPQAEDLAKFEGTLRKLWEAILARAESGDWKPRPGPLCRWCAFHEYCPAQGGQLLPLPDVPRRSS